MRKMHYIVGLDTKGHALGKDFRTMMACGRLGPDWARRSTVDPDLVTCSGCLDVLVARALETLEVSRISSREKFGG